MKKYLKHFVLASLCCLFVICSSVYVTKAETTSQQLQGGDSKETAVDIQLNTTYEAIVPLTEKNGKYSWERLTLSVQHIRGREFRKIYDNRIWEMNFVLKGLFKNTRFSSLAEIDEEHFFFELDRYLHFRSLLNLEQAVKDHQEAIAKIQKK